MKTFDSVWQLIIRHVGSEFKTKRKIPFKYTFVSDDTTSKVLLIWLSENIDSPKVITASKGSFEQAFKIGRCTGPGRYSKTSIGGQSYVWAILHDSKINTFE